MALKIEIFLPKESADYIEESADLQQYISELGDVTANRYGNKMEEEFALDELDSFIIIRDEELPNSENFENTDMFLVVPIESEE